MVGEKYIHENTGKCIDDYPEKEVILADIIRLLDGKTTVIVFNADMDLLYEGRVEYIKYTSEGCASSLLDKKVTYVDVALDNKLELCVEDDS